MHENRNQNTAKAITFKYVELIYHPPHYIHFCKCENKHCPCKSQHHSWVWQAATSTAVKSEKDCGPSKSNLRLSPKVSQSPQVLSIEHLMLKAECLLFIFYVHIPFLSQKFFSQLDNWFKTTLTHKSLVSLLIYTDQPGRHLGPVIVCQGTLSCWGATAIGECCCNGGYSVHNSVWISGACREAFTWMAYTMQKQSYIISDNVVTIFWIQVSTALVRSLPRGTKQSVSVRMKTNSNYYWPNPFDGLFCFSVHNIENLLNNLAFIWLELHTEPECINLIESAYWS